ncbi:MAG: type II secretion system protein [Phycisphaerae bacterium]
MRTSAAHHGFTLIEVLIVIVLIGLLYALIAPTFDTENRGGQLDETERRFRSVLAMARAEAMNQAARYRLSIRQDGRLDVLRQQDPIESPDTYVPVTADWAALPSELQHAWVESVALLPGGPPPVIADKDQTEFEIADLDTYEVTLVAVTDLEAPLNLDFEPDGSSASARWVLRDSRGVGVQMTLDGRIGRLEIADVPALPASEIVRPKPVTATKRG